MSNASSLPLTFAVAQALLSALPRTEEGLRTFFTTLRQDVTDKSDNSPRNCVVFHYLMDNGLREALEQELGEDAYVSINGEVAGFRRAGGWSSDGALPLPEHVKDFIRWWDTGGRHTYEQQRREERAVVAREEQRVQAHTDAMVAMEQIARALNMLPETPEGVLARLFSDGFLANGSTDPTTCPVQQFLVANTYLPEGVSIYVRRGSIRISHEFGMLEKSYIVTPTAAVSEFIRRWDDYGSGWLRESRQVHSLLNRAVQVVTDALNELPGTGEQVRDFLRSEGLLTGSSFPDNCPIYHFLRARMGEGLPHDIKVCGAAMGIVQVFGQRMPSFPGNPPVVNVTYPAGVGEFITKWDRSGYGNPDNSTFRTDSVS